jgi:hypothetical protein
MKKQLLWCIPTQVMGGLSLHVPTDELEFKIFGAGFGRLLYSNKSKGNGQSKFEVNLENQPLYAHYPIF